MLATSRGWVSNHIFYLASRSLAERYPDVIQVLLEELTRSDRFVQQNHAEAVRIIAESIGLDQASTDLYIRRRPRSPVAYLTPEKLEERQRIAEAFHKQNLIPHALQVREAFWYLAPRRHHITQTRREDIAMNLDVFWFLPNHGDGRYLGTTKGARQVDYNYLRQIVVVADTNGYDGGLIPNRRSCLDPWVVASSLIGATEKLKFLVAIRPGQSTPGLTVRTAVTFDRLSGGRLLVIR